VFEIDEPNCFECLGSFAAPVDSWHAQAGWKIGQYRSVDLSRSGGKTTTASLDRYGATSYLLADEATRSANGKDFTYNTKTVFVMDNSAQYTENRNRVVGSYVQDTWDCDVPVMNQAGSGVASVADLGLCSRSLERGEVQDDPALPFSNKSDGEIAQLTWTVGNT
jgi:hypothetical protein